MRRLLNRLRDWLSCPQHWHHEWRYGKFLKTGVSMDMYGKVEVTYQLGHRCLHCGQFRPDQGKTITKEV